MKYITATLITATLVLCMPFILKDQATANSIIEPLNNIPVQTPDYALGSDPLFVTDITSTDDGKLVVATKSDRAITIYNPTMTQKIQSWTVDAVPTGLAVKGDKIYATLDNSTLAVFDMTGKAVGSPVAVNMGARCPIVADDAIYVLEQFTNSVVKIDPSTMAVSARGAVRREPRGAALTQDGNYLFVANFLPLQRADLDYVAAEVSILDTRTMDTVKNIKLANGSNALRGITLSQDGKYVFVSHNLGRFTVPTSQLQQGWMNTSAMSVIDVENQSYIGAVVVDEPDRGAAGIWGIAEQDGKIVISHSGTHDVSIVDYQAFIDKLNSYSGDVETLSYDLQFLYGLRQRIPLAGNGPREMTVANGKVVIPTYFADTVNFVSLDGTARLDAVVPMVKDRVESDEQQGERIFNDAQYCFQQWQSCNGCHPGDGRTDGMNWDLMNDGIGNSKNCKSLLYSIMTAPSMISGIRASAEIANRKGFTHIQFYTISEEMALKVDAYSKSLEALPSPYLVNGELSDLAKEGKKVYEKLNCQECHSGPYFTDLKTHRIGDDIEFDAGWDTPTLREVWRTAPYLFDGRAETMYDVFAVHKHGIETKVSKKDLERLTEYVLSL